MKKELEESHLDLLRLDAVRAGEGTAAERRHVDACRVCRTEVGRMEKDVLGIEAAMPGPSDLSERDRGRILENLRGGSLLRPFRDPRARYALPLAAAAAALAAFMVIFPGGKNETPEPGGEPAVSEGPVERPVLDVNGDGFLDSGDVDELARIVGRGTGPADRWDFNGDGRTDSADVDFLSREIGMESDDAAFGSQAGC